MPEKKERYDIPVEPKAGAVGTIAVFVFGVLWILVAFAAAYLWTDADSRLAGAIGVAAIALPVTVGFFMTEVRHQRSGARWFVISAALLIGATAAWTVAEEDDFQKRRAILELPVEGADEDAGS